MKRKWFLVLFIFLLGCFVSSAFAASTYKRTGANPFYRPPLTSEADLRALVKSHNTQIRAGFSKAGYLNVYKAFSEQFPGAAIDTIKVAPGETFKWMFFRKKGTGPVIVKKDVTWGGAGPLDAYRFYIDVKSNRYELIVLQICGNFALKNVTKAPSAKTPATSGQGAIAAPAPMPSASGKTPGDPGSGQTGGAAGPAAPARASAADRAATDPAAMMPGAPGSGAAGSTAPAPGSAADRAATSPVAMIPGTPGSGVVTGPVAMMPSAPGSGAAGATTPTPSITADRAATDPAAMMPSAPGSGAAGSMPGPVGSGQLSGAEGLTAPAPGSAADRAATSPVAMIPGTPGSGVATGPVAMMPGAPGSGAAVSMPGPAGSGQPSGAAGPAGQIPGVSEKAAAAGPAAMMPVTPGGGAATGPAAMMPGAPGSGAASPIAAMPGAAERGKAASGMTASTAKFPGGFVADAGLSYQFDPATYLFARIGYEFPLFDKLSLMAYLGGSFRINGEDGGSAFMADVILDYHWWNRLSFGLGAGYWSGNDGQMDLIANLGFLLFGSPNSFNGTLFLEARSAVDELKHLNEQGRLGLGIRFRF